MMSEKIVAIYYAPWDIYGHFYATRVNVLVKLCFK